MGERMKAVMKKLEEASLLTSAAALSEEQLKRHQQWLDDNELADARHRESMEEHAAMMASIDDKLDRLTALILQGGKFRAHSSFE